MMKLSFYLFIICLTISCEYDYECKDVDYGRQMMLDSTRISFAYQGGEKLIFKTFTGEELTFHMVPSFGLRTSWIKLAQDVSEGSCVNEMKVRSELQSLTVNLNSDSLEYKIIYSHRVHSLMQGIKPIYYDIMSASIYNVQTLPSNWSLNTFQVLDSRGNESITSQFPLSYSFDEQIILNGRSFENVLYVTTPDSSGFYFNYDLGFIGFKERTNPLWVLDRIE